MGKLTRDLETSGALPGFRVDTAQIYDNRNGVLLIELGGQYLLYSDSGDPIPVYAAFAFFKPSTQSLARFSVTYLSDFKLDILPDITTIINSIRILSH
jgi:hypothetical protein